ncbi:hypothetical protein GOODEAATRI_030238, partial [Goodea atripinnis]
LNVIFSKFDEVQRSGNMIPCSGSGEFLFGFAPHRSAPLPVVPVAWRRVSDHVPAADW